MYVYIKIYIISAWVPRNDKTEEYVIYLFVPKDTRQGTKYSNLFDIGIEVYVV